MRWQRQMSPCIAATIIFWRLRLLWALAGWSRWHLTLESSGGLDMYIDYAVAAPNVALYCGDDNILASAAPLGACGLVSVASNVRILRRPRYVYRLCGGSAKCRPVLRRR